MLTQKMRRRLDILLADDGSPNALAAIQFVKSLPISRAAVPKSSITILEVVDPNPNAYEAPVRQAHLTQAEEILTPMGLVLHPRLVAGSPAEVILAAVDEIRPDLVITGAQGRGPTVTAMLGSVAQEIAEHARCPALIVRPSFEKLANILLVTDGSANSIRATRYLARFPLPRKTAVTVLYVMPHLPVTRLVDWPWPDPPLNIFERNTIPQVSELWQGDEIEGQSVLDRAVDILKDERIPARGVLLRGDPAAEIVDFARSENIDLIVAGGHGPYIPEMWRLGNVTRKLLQQTGCSTLVVRGKPALLVAP